MSNSVPGTSPSPEPGHEQTKECWSCATRIPLRARLCQECKAAQDWRGRIDRLAPLMVVLSLITALASVLSLATPVLRDWSRDKGADLRMVFVGTITNGIQLIIVNEGLAAAVVREAWLTTDVQHNHTGEVAATASDLQWHLLPEAGPLSQKYVRPGETAIMNLRVDTGFAQFPKLVAISELDRPLTKKEWVLELMLEAIQTDGASARIKTVGFVGFNTWDG